MEKAYRILILTDSNRNVLEVVMTDDILHTIQDIYVSHQTLFSTTQHLTRIVYEESFGSKQKAYNRYTELKTYPKMLRERLVRRHNPNWLNLYPIRPITPISNKKAVVCA